jgi:hypothetical protein
MCGHAVICEQGVQDGAEQPPLWGPGVEDQRSGDVVSYLHHLGAARQNVQDPIAQGTLYSISTIMMLIHDFDWLRKADCLSVSSRLLTPSLLWDSLRSNLNIETMLQISARQRAMFIQIPSVENKILI